MQLCVATDKLIGNLLRSINTLAAGITSFCSSQGKIVLAICCALFKLSILMKVMIKCLVPKFQCKKVVSFKDVNVIVN